MTVKHPYKVMIALMVLLAQAFIANAQEDEKRNTGESLGKQFLNNRVPGLQYAPAKPNAQKKITLAEQQENHNESSGMQLKKGTIKGMRFAPGGGGATFKSAARSTAKGQGARTTLSSDQKVGELKLAPTPVAPAIPTQGGVVDPKASTGTPPPANKPAAKEVKKVNNQ